MMDIGRKYQPAIVIDDGSHQADHILTSFQAIYPAVREGGLYIVEDLGMHAGIEAASHRGSAPCSPQEYFLRLARRVACPAEEVNIDAHFVAITEAVELFYGVAVMRKKEPRHPDRIEHRRAIVEQAEAPRNLGWFSRYVINNGGSVEDAIKLAERAIAAAPNEVIHYFELSSVLARAGQTEEALAAAEEALRRAPGNASFLHMVDRLSKKLGKCAKETPR